MPLLAVPIGLLIGLLLGATGGGGAILTVPVLVHLFGLDVAQATTGSLVVVGASSLAALLPRARQGEVAFGHGIAFGAIGAGGAVLGSRAAVRVDDSILLAAFSVLLLLVAVLMLRQSPASPTDQQHLQPLEPMVTLRPLGCACPRALKLVATATAVGLITGFLGVGGGFVLVPALVLTLSLPMPVAVGTSLLVITLNSGAALASRIGIVGVELDWTLIGVLTAATIAGALVGTRVSRHIPPRVLTRGFALLLVTVAVWTLVSAVRGAS